MGMGHYSGFGVGFPADSTEKNTSVGLSDSPLCQLGPAIKWQINRIGAKRMAWEVCVLCDKPAVASFYYLGYLGVGRGRRAKFLVQR